jgi:hypothetical protein
MPMMPAVPRNTVFVLMLAVPTFDMLAVPGRRYENNEVRANAGTVEGKLIFPSRDKMSACALSSFLTEIKNYETFHEYSGIFNNY